jgi:hypothetical protein
MSIYHTKQESRDLDLISKLFPNDNLYNPSLDKVSEQGYKEFGMDYFLNIVKSCDLLIFRPLPNGDIPAGVYKEIQAARDNNISILELPSFYKRKLSIENTRNYLKEIGFR